MTNKADKRSNSFFIKMVIVAFAWFFVGYNTVSGEMDWFYQHKLIAWIATVTLTLTLAGMLVYLANNSKKSQ